MYEPRIYRKEMNKERFRGFRIVVKETDLWIGVSPHAWQQDMEEKTTKFVHEIRAVLTEYISSHPDFAVSFDPIDLLEGDPEPVRSMKEAALKAGTGPMAAVAGMVAQETGRFLENTYDPDEYVIENGGDIFLKVVKQMTLRIFSGLNRHFGNIGLDLSPSFTPAGICTSSGMFGHSISLGKADSVTVVCRSASVSDAWATALANKIKNPADVRRVVETSFTPEMISLVCIKDDQVGIRGQLPVTRIE
jgi:ApbE superfamily uncharacterized protein (UPF0280 family)